MRRHLLVISIACSILLTACVTQAESASRPGEQQVAWGETVYRHECARCHASGRSGPELDARALVQYGNANQLYQFISATMPLDRPGTLPDEDYWDVTAYLLAEREMLQLPEAETLRPENAEDVNLAP
ncbi:MAG: cytochrome c [Dehalococcoidia bacterium]